jgi:hypothetical protein
VHRNVELRYETLYVTEVPAPELPAVGQLLSRYSALSCFQQEVPLVVAQSQADGHFALPQHLLTLRMSGSPALQSVQTLWIGKKRYR